MYNYVVVLGSNLCSKFGNSVDTLKNSVDEIRSEPVIKSLLESNWYVSLSFGDKTEPKYVNVGIRFSTSLKPKELLNFTSVLEKKYGRRRRRRWEPRTCDIDILLCDQLILPSRSSYEKWLKLDLSDQKRLAPNDLILPHPRMQERTFFLNPLNDLQPDWIHPFLKRKAKEMLDSLPPNELENIQQLQL